MAIWNILPTFGIFYDHLVHIVLIWYISSVFGIMHQEKSGNPDRKQTVSMRVNQRSFIIWRRTKVLNGNNFYNTV
jgi:hypothetical protein